MAGTARGLIVIPAFAGITTYGRQPAAPTNDPIAIVDAIANAPPQLTRSTARAIGALPAQAPSPPSSAVTTSHAADTVHGRPVPVSRTPPRSGQPPPTDKPPHDAPAPQS